MNDWRKILEEQSRLTFERLGRGLLLSRVPAVLRENGVEPQELLQGRKLLEYLSQEENDAFRLIQNEQCPAVWALVPHDADLVKPYSQYFPSSSNEEHRPPRFIPVVWQAFIRPLAEGFRRWLTIDGYMRFDDKPQEECIEGAVEVEAEYISNESSTVRSNVEVINNIENWAARHEIHVPKLLVARKPDQDSKENRSALVEFLKAIRPEDRSRISIPGDVLSKLLGIGGQK